MRRNIIFVGHPEKWNSGSSYLRSRQLGLLAAASPEFAGLNVSIASDLEGGDSIQILNKYALQHFTPEELIASVRRNNRLIADPLDGVFEPPLLELFDGVVAASFLQLDHYRSSLSKPVAYVGHHVDQRIKPFHQADHRNSTFSIGYFGELAHACFIQDLSECISFHPVDTLSSDETGWMDRLRDHQAHYAVRAPVTEPYFKPFTKGFIAAHCLSPVLVDQRDDEARRFLPDSYPYFTRTESPGDIRTTIKRMASDFEANSMDWILALASMQRVREQSEPGLIVRQLHSAISPLI